MPTGKVTSYDLTEGLYLDFESMIAVLSPFDVPLQGGMGADGRTALSSGTVFEKLYQWHDETLLVPRSTAAATATTGQTVITVASGDTLKFGTGDVVNIGTEKVRITGHGSTTDTLTVTRAFASTTAATIATSAVILGVGTALPEGSDPENARSRDRDNRTGYTEIFGPWAVHVSGTEQVIRKYGLEGTTEFDHQVANRLKEIAVAYEVAMIYGTPFEDLTNKWRTMAGLTSFITSHIDSTTTTITEATLLDQMVATFDDGGSPDRLLVGSKQKRVISTFTSSGTVQVIRADNTAGRSIDFFDNDFGRLSILLDRWMKVNDAIGFERDQAEMVTLRPFGMEMLAKTGDSVKGMVLGEKGLKFRRQLHAFRFSALT